MVYYYYHSESDSLWWSEEPPEIHLTDNIEVHELSEKEAMAKSVELEIEEIPHVKEN